MNARDIQNKKPGRETKFDVPYPMGKESRKQKESFWDKLSDLSLDTLADRIKFLVIFIAIGLGFILIGDVLKLILLKGTGIAFQINGWILITIAFLVPLFKFIDEKS
jgi:hypothetical protein